MVYKVVESEYGAYKASDGSLYEIMEAINVMTPQGKNVGWTEYDSIEEAAAAFNLTYNPMTEDEINILSILNEEVNK